MTTGWPLTVDGFPRPDFTTNTDDPGFELDVVVDHLADAIEALETYLGFQPHNTQTGTSYAAVAADALKIVTFNNTGAITFSIPSGVFATGQRIDCAVLGTGMVTVVPGTGTPAINGTPSVVSRARYSTFSVICLTSSSFLVAGDLA